MDIFATHTHTHIPASGHVFIALCPSPYTVTQTQIIIVDDGCLGSCVWRNEHVSGPVRSCGGNKGFETPFLHVRYISFIAVLRFLLSLHLGCSYSSVHKSQKSHSLILNESNFTAKLVVFLGKVI